MKKRSKIEVEIRNALSELLLSSIEDRKRAAVLRLILKYCEMCNKKKDIVFVKCNLHIHNDTQLRNMFEIREGNYIKIKRRYTNYQSFTCTKAKRYLGFLSHLFSGNKVFEDRIEDKIKIGVSLFNKGFYFECHEFLEQVWKEEMGRSKSFLKGLIHVSVAFYHLEYDNIKGAINYLSRSYNRLKTFEPSYLGVDVRAFLLNIDNFLRFLEESRSEYLKETIPKITLVDLGV